MVVTSGDAIRAELAKRAPGPMYKIGPEYDRSLWEGLGLVQTELAEARFIGISGLNREATKRRPTMPKFWKPRARAISKCSAPIRTLSCTLGTT